jgi:hypothetical protein
MDFPSHYKNGDLSDHQGDTSECTSAGLIEKPSRFVVRSMRLFDLNYLVFFPSSAEGREFSSNTGVNRKLGRASFQFGRRMLGSFFRLVACKCANEFFDFAMPLFVRRPGKRLQHTFLLVRTSAKKAEILRVSTSPMLIITPLRAVAIRFLTKRRNNRLRP